MKTNYILIDFENIQPENLSILKGYDFRIFVFVGANQTKVSFELATALQAFGDQAKYIKICGNGTNALDFHIAYYIGQLAEKNPNAYFHIISRDKGFDPLIEHLKANKILVQRDKDLSEIPILKISNPTTIEDKISIIVKRLIASGQSRPRKVKTLSNTINSLFMKTLDEPTLQSLITELKKRKLITVDKEKITYTLPITWS